MKNYLFVAAGAAVGGSFRYWLSGFIQRILPVSFPYGTLAVNILGSFILGFIIFYFDARELLSPGFRIALTIGFCGGFTTFSTFSYETLGFLRDSEYLLAFTNISLNVFFTLAALILSYFAAKIMIGE